MTDSEENGDRPGSDTGEDDAGTAGDAGADHDTGADGDAGDSEWTTDVSRLAERVAGLQEELEDHWRDDRVVFAKDATGTLVQCNRVFQTFTDRLSRIAADRSAAWHEDIVTLAIPEEQPGERRVAVPTSDGETSVVPVKTTSGGVAWARRSLSLADLDRWRDRTLTRHANHSARSRGTQKHSQQFFLPPAALGRALEQLALVLDDLEAELDVAVDHRFDELDGADAGDDGREA